MKYLTSMRFGRTRSTSDKNQPSVELSLMTTSSPSFGISPLVCVDGVTTVSVVTGSKLSTSKLPKYLAGMTREMSRLNEVSFVFQLKLALARHCYHGSGTMVMHQVLGFPSLCGDFLLGWRLVEINLHSRL